MTRSTAKSLLLNLTLCLAAYLAGAALTTGAGAALYSINNQLEQRR